MYVHWFNFFYINQVDFEIKDAPHSIFKTKLHLKCKIKELQIRSLIDFLFANI